MIVLYMDQDMNCIRKFHRDESGATTIEYCVMMFFILITCIVGISALGDSSNGLWGRNSSQLSSHM